MPFDRSGCDLTAHAIRALHAWRAPGVDALHGAAGDADARASADGRIAAAIDRGFRYLAARQHADGSWLPLWFGDQYARGEENPVYGTAKVLAAYRDVSRLDSAPARRALDWLAAAVRAGGRWGGLPEPELVALSNPANIESTALAVEALLGCGQTAVHQAAAQQGLTWLVDAVEANRHQECSPIGFYFAKLWYYEKLYPLIWTVAALGQAARRPRDPHEMPAVVHTSKT
jgi:squalene-hopene/tetraprenyl-beta-curcumene cyclase